MTVCCAQFIHPAKQISRHDSGFIARLSLDWSGTTSFALERTTSAPLAIPRTSADSVRSNFRTLRDANNVSLVTYTRGRDLSGSWEGAGGIGGLLGRTDNLLQESTYYHADANGNVTLLVDNGHQVAARYLYDPYGNQLAVSGRLGDANRYRFSSKEIHPSSGLVYYLYRFYEPNLQRWPNRDPLGELGFGVLHLRSSKGGGSDIAYAPEILSPYGFVRNAPLQWVDLDGRKDGYTVIIEKPATKVVTRVCVTAGRGSSAYAWAWSIGWFIGESGSGPLAEYVVPDSYCNSDPLPCPKRRDYTKLPNYDKWKECQRKAHEAYDRREKGCGEPGTPGREDCMKRVLEQLKDDLEACRIQFPTYP